MQAVSHKSYNFAMLITKTNQEMIQAFYFQKSLSVMFVKCRFITYSIFEPRFRNEQEIPFQIYVE